MDTTKLEKARESLKPAVPDLLEGLGKRERYESLKEWRSELVEAFKQARSNLRLVQRDVWKGEFSALKIEADAVKSVLQKHRGKISPEMYQQAYEARKNARDSLGKSLKEHQGEQHYSFPDWLKSEAKTDPKALAVFGDMERRKTEKAAVDTAISKALDDIQSQRSRAPHADPETRNPRLQEGRARDKLYERHDDIKNLISVRLDQLESAKSRLGLWDKIIPWTQNNRDVSRLAQELATLHISQENAKPRKSAVEDAQFLARTHAENAQKSFSQWDKTTGQTLNQRESLIQGIQESLENKDPKMRAAILAGGIDMAIQLQAQREAEELRRIQEQQKLARGTVIPMHRQSGFSVPKMG